MEAYLIIPWNVFFYETLGRQLLNIVKVNIIKIERDSHLTTSRGYPLL